MATAPTETTVAGGGERNGGEEGKSEAAKPKVYDIGSQVSCVASFDEQMRK